MHFHLSSGKSPGRHFSALSLSLTQSAVQQWHSRASTEACSLDDRSPERIHGMRHAIGITLSQSNVGNLLRRFGTCKYTTSANIEALHCRPYTTALWRGAKEQSLQYSLAAHTTFEHITSEMCLYRIPNKYIYIYTVNYSDLVRSNLHLSNGGTHILHVHGWMQPNRYSMLSSCET